VGFGRVCSAIDRGALASHHRAAIRRFRARRRGGSLRAFADPAIKEMFVDADHFMAMVRDRYAPVYRHRSVEFGEFA
jgi:hypothetical protein